MRARRQFDALFAAHSGAVYAYARRRISVGEADDIVADTFTVVWRQLATVPERPLPYLLGIARKVIANRRRSLRRRGALVERLGTELSIAAAPLGRDELAASEAVRVLALVPELEREALLLIALGGAHP